MMPSSDDANARILLVEDDPVVLTTLSATMEYGGFDPVESTSAFEAFIQLQDREFDAILLDLGLPDTEGGRLIREIRKRSDVPIVVVSGDSSEETKIAALDAGADDFVQKPFRPGELLARVRAALRRGLPLKDKAVAAATVAQSEQAEFLGPLAIKEGSKEKKLLDFLQNNPKKLATNEDIIAAVWGNVDTRTEKNVRVLVAMLRRKLKAQHSELDIINEHGRGYRLRTPAPLSSPDRSISRS